MKIKALVNPQFFVSLNKLLRAEIPVALAWKLRGLAKYLETTHESYDTMRRELLTKYSEKNEKGESKSDAAGNVVFIDEAAKQSFIKDHQELLDQEVAIERKVKIHELSTVKLSASDLFVLEDLIEE